LNQKQPETTSHFDPSLQIIEQIVIEPTLPDEQQ
jgi:hypothetical protein